MHFAIPYFPSRLIILGELVHVHTLTSVLLPFMRGHLIICWLSSISQKTIHYTHISTNPYHRRDSIERIGSCSSGDLWLINNNERALLLPFDELELFNFTETVCDWNFTGTFMNLRFVRTFLIFDCRFTTGTSRFIKTFFLIMRNQRLSNPYYNSRSTVHFEQNWLKIKT